MSVFPGSPRLLKGAFFRYDGIGEPPSIIVFPYNPETLTRTISPAIPGVTGHQPSTGQYPQQTIEFTLPLDATDALEQSNAQAIQTGVYPLLSAIELLMYPSTSGAMPLVLFAWGPCRILPVRVIGLTILERLFEPQLSPIQASVRITLLVESADFKGLIDFPQSIAILNSFAVQAYSPSPAATGFTPPAAGV